MIGLSQVQIADKKLTAVRSLVIDYEDLRGSRNTDGRVRTDYNKIRSEPELRRMAEGKPVVIRRYQLLGELRRRGPHRMEQLGHHKKEQETHRKVQGPHRRGPHRMEPVLHKRQLELHKS